MSYKSYDVVWAHQFDSPTEKLVMLAIAKHADEGGKSWPKVKTIAGFCGIAPRTVQRQLKKFEQAGLLAIQEEYRPDGGQTSNRYVITLPAVQSMLPSDRAVTEGVSLKSPPPQTAACRGGDDTAVTPQELPTEPKKGIQQLTETGLRYPEKLEASDRMWISNILQDVPSQDAQQLLDELAAALKAGRIRGRASKWFNGLILNYRKGLFCPMARPSKPNPMFNETPVETHAKPNTRNKEARNQALESMKKFTSSKLVR
jgi:DNA-binding MarR family transcriptional regulator